VGKDLMNEADEEHHVARMLIAELDANAAPDHRFAKFTVPAESVRHHIKEEAKELDIDFEALGQQVLDREKDLKQNGIPADAEHAMVVKANGKGDSPAAASRRGFSADRKRTKKAVPPNGKTSTKARTGL